MSIISAIVSLVALLVIAGSSTQIFPNWPNSSLGVSQVLFNSLEELARIVDNAYCVGSTGIQYPFKCLNHCDDFPSFELVTTWHTGPLMTDSCGYIAVSHPPLAERIIVAFRGTYSLADTVADLNTYPVDYKPYIPNKPEREDPCISQHELSNQGQIEQVFVHKNAEVERECGKCTVHSGFWSAWQKTRCFLVSQIEDAMARFPGYRLELVGHSLGGAVAALASLELQTRGLNPHLTTFGEPRMGNCQFAAYFNKRFNLTDQDPAHSKYVRVTHVGDPIPLLPAQSWGFYPHAGEIFISKGGLPPTPQDLQQRNDNKNPRCASLGSASADSDSLTLQSSPLWDPVAAHRDYFWRLGVCLPHLGGM